MKTSLQPFIEMGPFQPTAPNGVGEYILIVNARVGSIATSLPAIDTGIGWHPDAVLKIFMPNAASAIIGMGGNGGRGGQGPSPNFSLSTGGGGGAGWNGTRGGTGGFNPSGDPTVDGTETLGGVVSAGVSTGGTSGPEPGETGGSPTLAGGIDAVDVSLGYASYSLPMQDAGRTRRQRIRTLLCHSI